MKNSKITDDKLKNAAKNHQLNIQRNLEHRLKVATTQENQELIQLLEAEFKQLLPRATLK